MNETFEFWVVEQFVELGNESFWHEKARLIRHKHHTDEKLIADCRHIGKRDVTNYGGRYRIRVTFEQTILDSEEISV